MKSLKLEEYEALFESEGYFTDEDVENLKGLTKKDLRSMGITKRGENNIHGYITTEIIHYTLLHTCSNVANGGAGGLTTVLQISDICHLYCT